MRILVACEESQAVCIAFRELGHIAFSCDIEDCSGGHPEWHIKCDVLNLLQFIRPFKTQDETIYTINRWDMMMYYDCDRIAIENPVGCISTYIRKPDQIIQPYNFGEDASKKTCLWLKGLPKLKNTLYFPPRVVNGKNRWSNQTDSGQNKLAPSETRATDRSKTYPGIAKAMAEQWGEYQRHT